MAALQTVIMAKANITGGAFEALSGQSGDTASVASAGVSPIQLIDVWGISSDAAFEFDIRSTLLHDNTRGIRLAGTPLAPGAVTANGCQILWPWNLAQKLTPGDTLTVEVNGTNADDAVLALNILYSQLSVASARFIDVNTLRSRMVNLLGIKVAPTASGTAGAYGTARAFNADDDRLRANTDYAILGLTTTIPFVSAQLQGYDFGNFRIGIPGYPYPERTSPWFVELSLREGLPLVPVFNSNNKASTTVTVIDGEASTAPVIDFVLAQLA